LCGLAGRPTLNLGTEPKLDAALSEIEYRPWHVVVALLVLKHGVAVREAEDFGHALGVDQIFRGYLR
jgi:hypothetical protein